MTPQSAALLAATWSWADAVLSTLLLGVLVPAGIAMTLTTVVLGLVRRDWRLVPGAVLATVLFVVAGVIALVEVRPPVPGQDYWIGLDSTLGALVLGVGVLLVARHAWGEVVALRNVREASWVPSSAEAEPVALPQPAPRKHLNAVTAEHHVAEWMWHLGAVDARVTPFRRDGGVDVRSAAYVAQVKHRADFVTVEAMRALVGVARLEGRQPLFFTSGTYSRDALATASAGDVALFVFRPREGRLVAANALAQRLRAAGLRGPVAAPVSPNRDRMMVAAG